jgi:hypothetical protein
MFPASGLSQLMTTVLFVPHSQKLKVQVDPRNAGVLVVTLFDEPEQEEGEEQEYQQQEYKDYNPGSAYYRYN